MAENDTHYNETNFEDNAETSFRPDQNQNNNNGSNNNTAIAPLPNVGEGGPVYPGNENNNIEAEPVIPLPTPGEGGPVYPGDQNNNTGEGGGTTPGRPNRPGGGLNRPGGGTNRPGGTTGGGTGGTTGGFFPSMPSFPSRPSTPSTPITPIYPSYPNISPQNFGQVRFLNASANNFPVNISIDGNAYAINSRFGTITNYDWVSDGFHTVTVRRASGMRSILLQQNFPFVAGQKVTMVLTDTASGSLELVWVIDTGCNNLPYNSGCYRFANMTYSGSRFDLLLYGGETVFRNVGFQTVTSYKQAVSGSYQFYVTNSNTYTFLRELPIIVIGAIGTTANVQQPLLSLTADIMAGTHYTSYLIGNTWSDLGLRVMTVED